MEKKNLFGLCPYVTSQKVLTGKWSMYIMYLLTDGPIRFNELQRKILPKNKYLYEEERRLFYVALTRTKNNVYLLVNRRSRSIYIKEIKKEIKKSHL